MSEPTSEAIAVAEPQESQQSQESQESQESQAAETIADALVERELLVEDVSIDGMCGVY